MHNVRCKVPLFDRDGCSILSKLMNKHFRFSGSNFSRLEELGVRASVVLRRAGLSQGFIDQPRLLLKTEELFALWRAVGEISTDPGIGLLLGTESKTERFHPIGLAALSSENFGSAIDQMARYKQLTCPEEILQEKDDVEWRIQFRWLLAEEVEPPVLIECCFAWVLSTARHGTGRACRRSVWNSYNLGRTRKTWSAISAAPLAAEPRAMLSFFAPPTPSIGSLLAMLSFWRCLPRSSRKS